jgi:hypothetical protein
VIPFIGERANGDTSRGCLPGLKFLELVGGQGAQLVLGGGDGIPFGGDFQVEGLNFTSNFEAQVPRLGAGLRLGHGAGGQRALDFWVFDEGAFPPGVGECDFHF